MLSQVNAKGDEGFNTQLVSLWRTRPMRSPLIVDRLLGTCDRRPLEPRGFQTGYYPKLHPVKLDKLRPLPIERSTTYANHHRFRASHPKI